MHVGILALQGDVAEHEAALRRVGAAPRCVRRPADLYDLAGLILPGGESTTMGQLAAEYGMLGPLRDFVASGKPVWGTCAGMILLAESAGREQPLVGGLDVVVERNHFGRQVDSFEIDLSITGLDGGPFHAVFIRAPAIATAGPAVTVMARLNDGTIVAVRQGALLATAFHPELAGDDRLHRYFLEHAEPARVM